MSVVYFSGNLLFAHVWRGGARSFNRIICREGHYRFTHCIGKFLLTFQGQKAPPFRAGDEWPISRAGFDQLGQNGYL
jgi:hypothetical protein